MLIRLATGVNVRALVQNDGTAADLSQGTPVQVYLAPETLRVLAGEDMPQDEDEFEVAAAS